MDFRLPELGEGVYEAELTRWLVTVGDQVAPGKGLLEVLTDKATMEVPAPFAGVITHLAAEPGRQVKVGQVVLAFDPVEDGAPSASAAPARDGHTVPASRPKAGSGVVAPPATPVTPLPVEMAVKAAPAVRQLARKLGIDLATVHGTGPAGRVLLEDLKTSTSTVESHATEAPPADRRLPEQRATEPRMTEPRAPEPTIELGRAGTRVKLQGVRRKIAEHMIASKRSIPHYTYVDECDVTELVRTRVALRDAYAARGVKLTYLAFAARAVASALREVPAVNATFEEEAQELVLHEACDLGIAVAAPMGLMVPVIRNADRLSLFDLAREIQRLGDEARAGKTRLEDLRGGTFTITSIGNIGGLFATPIINQPQVGILGLGKVVRRPVFDPLGQVIPADLVYLSFSFDHRVLDGAIGATFGNAVLKRLQKPLELAIDLP